MGKLKSIPIREAVGACISGTVTSIKRILSYNRAIKAIDRKAYDIAIEEEISLLEEMYSNPLFAQLLDSAFWNDALLEKAEYGKTNSILTSAERNIANYYLIWKEEKNEKECIEKATDAIIDLIIVYGDAFSGGPPYVDTAPDEKRVRERIEDILYGVKDE